MPYLREITVLINNNIKATTLSDKRFDKGSFYSIARLIKREEEQTVTIPAIVPNNGQATDLTIDDSKPFILYHRILNIEYENIDSYGDLKHKKETANMLAIVYGDRNILKTEPEQIIAAIEAGFPQELTEAQRNTYNLHTTSIDIGTININSDNVWDGEYTGGVTFRLQPERFLYSISYTIISEYDPSCIDIC